MLGLTVVRCVAGSYPTSLGGPPRVITVDFPMLSLGADRGQQLQDNGSPLKIALYSRN